MCYCKSTVSCLPALRGIFLAKGAVLLNAQQGEMAVLSLGFRDYAAMAVRLTQHRSSMDPERVTRRLFWIEHEHTHTVRLT